MRGVIDIGSNTIRLSIYKVLENDQIIHMFHNKTFVGLQHMWMNLACCLTRGSIKR